MKVSVILTTHGEGKYLPQAIASVLAQTSQDWELLVAIDGNAEDSNCSWMNFEEYDERIRGLECLVPDGVINRYAYTINRAVAKARGEYLTYLCHDDLYLPWRLDAFAYVLDHNPEVDIVYGQQQLLIEEEGITRLAGVRDTVGVCRQAAQRIDHSSVMHRRECFEKVGGWDESAPMRYGDAYFWARLNAAGYAFHPVPAPMDCHRYNPESVTYKIDHPEAAQYPPYDDQGNKRLVKSGVDPVFSAVD